MIDCSDVSVAALQYLPLRWLERAVSGSWVQEGQAHVTWLQEALCQSAWG